jgi:sugar (pentulose or hexulose) kinase
MPSDAQILIFDIGKTNKKVFVFNENYKIIYEKENQIAEIEDEDGYPCEDLDSLVSWIGESFVELNLSDDVDIRAVNFSAYGASFVHVEMTKQPATPLYNYLKPFPQDLQNRFYERYGGLEKFAVETASPILGNLNSGLQLYRLKMQKPKVFAGIKYSMHLPQYLSWIFTERAYSDITSIGCHTALWDFQSNDYHRWVREEGIIDKLPPILPSDQALSIDGPFIVGIGLHDSSAALIPYLSSFKDPFVLISTGTWCISLNPFNQSPLTIEELKADCLCYKDYKGKSVKAARLFAGHEHEQAVKKIADLFQLSSNFYRDINFDTEISNNLNPNAIEAYYDFMVGLVAKQVESTNLVLNGSAVRDIYVDGGFSKNTVFMNLLAQAYPDKRVWAATVAQSTALGAAIAIHSDWNKKDLPSGLIEKRLFRPGKENFKII